MPNLISLNCEGSHTRGDFSSVQWFELNRRSAAGVTGQSSRSIVVRKNYKVSCDVGD